MLPHALLSLLVFEHGFIQIRFGIFEFFCFCFMSHKYFLILLNFTRYLSSCKHNFFIDEKRTQWNLNTNVKLFHESISCFMKWPWNCISWNSLKEKFHSVSSPLESFHIPCPKTLRTAKRIKRYTIPGETLTVPGTMKKNSEFLMRPLEWILRCDPIFSFYIHPFPFKLLKMEVSL